MNKKTLRALLGVAVAVCFLVPAAFAQKKPLDLSALKGRYSGTVSVEGPGGLSSGTAAVIIKVPKRGKTATFDYLATVSDGMGGSSELPSLFTLEANKTVLVTDLGVGIAGANNAKPGAGTWSQRKRTLSFSATNGDIVLVCTATAKNVGKRKRKLTMMLNSTDAGGSTVYSASLRAKLPKRPK